MNYELEQRIRADLRSNEKLLWAGQPAQGLRLRGTDVIQIPLSLFWASSLSYIVFTATSRSDASASGFLSLLWIPLSVVVGYLVIGRFVVDAALRARTYYAITNQRAVILTGLVTPEFRSLWLKDLREISWKMGPGALGTLEFGSSPKPTSWLLNRASIGTKPVYGYELIEEPRHVYDLLMSAIHTVREVGA